MATKISVGAVINSILLNEQLANPATPPANFWQLYVRLLGLHTIDDAGNVVGPMSDIAGNGGWEFISENILAAPGTITFAAIPNTFTKLRLEVTPRGSNASVTETMKLQMGNGGPDAGANYSYMVRREGFAASQIQSIVGTSIDGMIIPANTATANYFGQAIYEIFNYTAAIWKTIIMLGGHTDGAGYRICYGSGLWRSNAIIDTLFLFCTAAANLQTGSIARLYGAT